MKKKLLLGTAFAVFSLQTAFAAALTLPPVNYRDVEVYIPFGATRHDAHGIGLQPAEMLAATMPVGALTYEDIKNYFIGNNIDYLGHPLNNGFISRMPLADDDYTSPYDEPGQTHDMPFEQNTYGGRLSKAEQLVEFRKRLHEVWRNASAYQEFSTLITKLYNVANAHRVAENINRTAFDKEFILSLFTSSTIAYVGAEYPIPKTSCGQGAVERITMDLSTYRYLEHFPQATREMSDALKSIIGFFNGQGGINSLIQGNNWVDYCDDFGPVQRARTPQQKLDALMTQCIKGFFKIISANNLNMDAYARRYPQRPINFNAYDHRTRAFPLMPGAPERITFEAAIRSALKQYASIPNLQTPLVDYNDWLDFAEAEIAVGHRRGAKFRTAAPQAAVPQAVARQIDMARYTVPNIPFTLVEILNRNGGFMYQGREIQPQGWDCVMATLAPYLQARGEFPYEFNGVEFEATSCSQDYVIFRTNHRLFHHLELHHLELLVRHEDISGHVASFTQAGRRQHADPQAGANNAQLDPAARAPRAMGEVQPAQQVVLPVAEARFPVVSFRTVTLDGNYQDDINYCDVNDRYIGNNPFSGWLLAQNGEAARMQDIAADSMENGTVIACDELLRDNPRLRQLEITYPGLRDALRSDFARGRSIAFFRFNALTVNATLGRRALASDHYVFTIGNVRTTGAAVPTQPVVEPTRQYAEGQMTTGVTNTDRMNASLNAAFHRPLDRPAQQAAQPVAQSTVQPSVHSVVLLYVSPQAAQPVAQSTVAQQPPQPARQYVAPQSVVTAQYPQALTNSQLRENLGF